MRSFFVLAASLLLATSASAQTSKQIKVRIVYDTTAASSAAVGPLLVQKIAGQPKFFTIATGDDKDLAIVTDCYRATPSDPPFEQQRPQSSSDV